MSATVKSILEGGSGLDGKYIPDLGDLGRVVGQLRDSGFSVVLTQGVYDMFHVGHKRYLEAASKLGDVLIVGVDSDELTRATKGQIDPTRPFDPFESRIELLGAMYFIKIITRRHTDHHTDDLIKLVRPEVLVVSKTTSSFTQEKIAELREFCGEIRHLEAQADPNITSTTAKLRRLRSEGAKELAAIFQRVMDEYLSEGGK